ncbi:MAG TPA: bifunctional phosphoribosylaminoimidazolecarboxamide formyltransferase/IMP cyclohydrolase [Tepidisphaeraceae bacterium]|jgi:phosphoribosylaminoimidazolecarboxamide formyltransferase/IMP cyclohydrolase|nr:bifunctional phosphoribosylaminoimidazolecarboxamide formyltransferase/IMP cyclohydrolase [Tepidisphaeraceae bacterium]
MSNGLVPVQRALVSVSDKTGLIEFASALANEFNIELISTGGTAMYLRDAGLPVTDVADLTGFPEMMDGRVKTLHPAVHGGLLAVRDNPSHVEALRQHNIRPIDLVVVNLYPFEQTIARPGTTFEQAIEQIDIGGPSMIRSAAKNHRWVLVVTAPDRYEKVLGDLREHGGSSCAAHRLKQACRAFATTAAYDAAIADYLTAHAKIDPTQRTLVLHKAQDLRYGENPHQPAALWIGKQPAEASVAFAKKLHGKELSYINLLDADGALNAVKEFAQPAACIVKHATPCGCCQSDTLAAAFAGAYAGDPLAAFGGIVALNRPVDLAAAEAITAIDKLLEVIVAPAYDPAALELLRSRWKNVRLLEIGDIPPGPAQFDPAEQHMHKIVGGYLIQQRDRLGLDETGWKIATRRAPTESEMRDLRFAWLACKHVKSNAIVLARERAMVGAGGGQVDRVGAASIAIAKAGPRARGAVAASDAFFPFPDGPELLLQAGITAIIHPGGALKDADTIVAADHHGAAVVLTGQRHFKH